MTPYKQTITLLILFLNENILNRELYTLWPCLKMLNYFSNSCRFEMTFFGSIPESYFKLCIEFDLSDI